MTKQEAIEILEEVKELDDTMYAYNPAYMNALDMAIEVLKEIQLYEDNKLCLVPEDVYSRQCSELDTYKEIGTVEECRKAVEKQAAERVNYETNAVFNNGFGCYRIGKCPICNSCYNSNNEIKYCSKCGKKLDWSKENE